MNENQVIMNDITCELRGLAFKSNWLDYQADESARRLNAIADYIDATMEGMVELPKDADGEPIHIGDELDYLEALHTDVPAKFKVQDMFYFGKGEWRLRAYPATYEPKKCRHYHAPTVKDILLEFGEWYTHTKGGCDEDDIIAEYAAKLRLAEEDA